MHSLMVKEFGTKETGSWRASRPVLNEEECTKCGLCIEFCPEGVILELAGDRLEVDMVFCKGCGICVEECPTGAMTLVDE